MTAVVQEPIVYGSSALLPDGAVLSNVHSEARCHGRTCVIHAPTGHHMRTWPLVWRQDRGLFERRCPHGIGHPDPDQLEYLLGVGASRMLDEMRRGLTPDETTKPEDHAEAEMTHGCDGCCQGAGS